MNPVALLLLGTAVVVAAFSLPLARRRIRPNPFYGLRLPVTFRSEAAWYELNALGGRLFLAWSAALALLGFAGLLLPRHLWPIYNWSVLAATLAGLALVVFLCLRAAARWSPPPE